MKSALELALHLADKIMAFPLGNCGPSDDPDKQYAYTASFRDYSKRFVAAVKRIGDPDLSSMVAELDTSPEYITQAHDLRAELYSIIDALKEAASDPAYAVGIAANSAFLNTGVLSNLMSLRDKKFDTRKLAKMCTELNDAYSRGNYISCALLLRAIINHVPPVFAATTFAQVVANSGRSIGAVLSRLNDDARPIADFHTHILIRSTESLPTKNQLEPYKPATEILIQEVIAKLNEAST